ncbi:glycosylphosphatidylinositol-specific phospholipase c [Stylonychia lemnae]|uniref:Glycosylphosphatidylinositol-specific phospholipase c n=1 Tax=Stylonychia lemnae TaxID=5949 RepID=A0A077ZRV2_STYLE|nr:glycosylphosphatidylinositol-specific phospholipase c [Stylonychia lemnae]|eukprot:CDW71216.1 glycosylphosphatidylinositol-specific phospholipase c [Stylonychia lemnae]
MTQTAKPQLITSIVIVALFTIVPTIEAHARFQPYTIDDDEFNYLDFSSYELLQVMNPQGYGKVNELFFPKTTMISPGSSYFEPGINVEEDVPKITSLSTWMTDLKKYKKIAPLKINQIAIPGAHHAGLTYLLPLFESVQKIFRQFGLESDSGTFGLPKEYLFKIVNSLLVPHHHSVAQILEQGGRYLDLRVARDINDPQQIYLAHCFLSKIRLNDTLADINEFLNKNPGEIIFIDIPGDDGPLGTVGDSVPHQQIDHQIRKYIDSKFILSRKNISQPISTYGGIYFSSFEVNSTIDQIKIKGGWSMTHSDNPYDVIQNIQEYYENGSYLKQEPLDYDVLKCDPYITGTKDTMIQTIKYETLLQKYDQPVDPLINARFIPANLKSTAQLTNPLFYNSVYRSKVLTQVLNIIEMDDFNSGNAIRAIEININRYYP